MDEHIYQLQSRLNELGYYQGAMDGVYGPATKSAVEAFKYNNGLVQNSNLDEKTVALIHADIARPSEQQEDEIVVDQEMYQILGFYEKISAASDLKSREEIYLDGFLTYGFLFLYGLTTIVSISLSLLQDPEVSEFEKEGIRLNEPFMNTMLEEAQQVFFDWLTGVRSSGRADEAERRAQAGKMTLKSNLLMMYRIAAIAILLLPEGHPDRDVSLALEGLNYNLKRTKILDDPYGQLLTIQTLISYKLLSESQTLDLIFMGKRLLNSLDDVEIHYEFLTTVFLYYISRGYEFQDAAELKSQDVFFATTKKVDKNSIQETKKWAKLAQQVYDEMQQLPVKSDKTTQKRGALTVLAGLFQSEKVADLLKQMLENADEVLPQIALIEAKIRFYSGKYERVIELLTPTISLLEDHYLMAVREEDIRETGNSFSRAVLYLAYACASTGNWGQVVDVMDRSKGLRLRYEAALRSSPKFEKLHQLQARRYAVSRGILPTQSSKNLKQWEDWLGYRLTPETRILEEYRRARPKLSGNLLTSPGVGKIAKTLNAGEAAVLLATSRKGTIAVVVCSGDIETPTAGLILEALDLNQVLKLFLGEKMDGWLMELGGRLDPPYDPRGALDQLLSVFENELGKKLDRVLIENKIQSVVVIPGGWLNFVPFWALPSLSKYDVQLYSSASQFVNGWNQVEQSAIQVAVAVGDPTIDLPISAIEVHSVDSQLKKRKVQIRTLLREQATQSAIFDALKNANLFHFSGHGRSPFGNDLKSTALLVSPDWNRMPITRPGDLEQLAAGELAWEHPYLEMRVVDLENIGRLIELQGPGRNETELTLEYSEQGTLWGQYHDKSLVRIAEQWSAEDLLTSEVIQNCRLAFISSCSAGYGGHSALDEYSGLVTALQLAGVPTVITTLWPVTEEVSSLFVDLFYKNLVAVNGAVSISETVQKTSTALREMSKDEAADQLTNLRKSLDSPMGRFYLEKVIHEFKQGPERPFSHPYDWAAFYVSGPPNVEILKE